MLSVHNHLIGGGFGRRLEVDGVVRAGQIARHVDGPVKVVWTREEDVQHDMYRPLFFDRLAAGLDGRGMPIAWSCRFAGSSILARFLPPAFSNGLDPDTVEGAVHLAYALPNLRVEYLRVEPPGIPTAFWRSVGPSHNVFVTESFMDELAAAAGQDPVAYRLALLDEAPRAKAVLALAAQRAGWGESLPQGIGRGVSLQTVFGTVMATVAEVEVPAPGSVRVRRVVCALDCGVVVNPDTVRAQVEGAVVFGITAALHGEITLRDGRVEQANFDDYRMLRIDEAPAVEVHIVPSAEPPGRMGEPGTSAGVPPGANAGFAATGRRVRELPIRAAALARSSCPRAAPGSKRTSPRPAPRAMALRPWRSRRRDTAARSRRLDHVLAFVIRNPARPARRIGGPGRPPRHARPRRPGGRGHRHPSLPRRGPRGTAGRSPPSHRRDPLAGSGDGRRSLAGPAACQAPGVGAPLGD